MIFNVTCVINVSMFTTVITDIYPIIFTIKIIKFIAVCTIKSGDSTFYNFSRKQTKNKTFSLSLTHTHNDL